MVRWIVLTLVAGVTAGAALMFRSRGKTDKRPEVGAVSDEWITTHRADSPPH
jgi:hypothetical protein